MATNRIVRRAREVRIADPLEGDEDEVIPYRYAVSSYGADFPVDSLLKRMREGSIYVPHFQRNYVWKHVQASRFIESILLGLPVPGVFFARDEVEQKFLIIDGQQRLLTLFYFFEGVFGDSNRAFRLKNVVKDFDGCALVDLSDEDRRSIEDYVIHATIVKQEQPDADASSIYHVFERLNTGGSPLSPQEIRTSLFHGPLTDLLYELNEMPFWRAIAGQPNARMKDQELILRFLALRERWGNYKSPMKVFLNKYAGSCRTSSKRKIASLRKVFESTISEIYEVLGDRAFKPDRALNAAVFDSICVGVAERLASGPIENPAQIEKAYFDLLNDAEFVAACERATANELQVEKRIEKSIKRFSRVK